MKARLWSEVLVHWELNAESYEAEVDLPEELIRAHAEALKRFVELDDQITEHWKAQT